MNSCYIFQVFVKVELPICDIALNSQPLELPFSLTVARQFRLDSYLSVSIVDKRVPCYGATGAGINTNML